MTEESKETQELFDQVVKMIKDRVAIEKAAAEQKAQDFHKAHRPSMSNDQQKVDKGELDE